MINWKNLKNEPPTESGRYVIVNIKYDEYESRFPWTMDATQYGWNTHISYDGTVQDSTRIFFEKEEDVELYYCTLEDWKNNIKRMVLRKEVE